MNKTLNKAVKQTIGLGAVAGMRSSLAPAIASHYFNRHPKRRLAKSNLSFIQSPTTSIITKVLGAAEITGDKVPGVPNRIVFSSTLGRVVSGALVGAAIFKSKKQNLWNGALIGGAAALGSTFATFYIRKYLSKIPYVKDPLLGVVEDLIAVSTGLSVMKGK